MKLTAEQLEGDIRDFAKEKRMVTRLPYRPPETGGQAIPLYLI